MVRRNLYNLYSFKTDVGLAYTPDSQSDGHALHHDSKSTSAKSHSVEESNVNLLPLTWRRSLSRHLERSPSPATNIDQLRRVLAGSVSRGRDSIPKIEINGEKLATPAESNLSIEKEEGDVTRILESLNVNGRWKEKNIRDFNEKVEGTIRPPYGI
jgi:hypothetical protein